MTEKFSKEIEELLEHPIEHGEDCCPWCGEMKCTKEHHICGRCYDDVKELFPANCNEKPEKLLGAPIGMYHCPDCGTMVLAGVIHPPLCQLCIDRKHPGFDRF